MESTVLPQSPRVIALIEALHLDKMAMLNLSMAMLGEKNSPIFPLDLMAFGAVKRSLSLTSAMQLMVESRNMVCSRALLRLHIDTSLRFSAAWMVEEPHDFASKVLGGARIDKIKDREGKSLTDARLVEVRSAGNCWLPAVYKHLSGYVHFSGAHIYDSIANLNDENRTTYFELTEIDMKFAESSWIEVLDCFRNSTKMLAEYLHGYRVTKQMSQAESIVARKEVT